MTWKDIPVKVWIGPTDLDLLETAWGVIANAGGGNWTLETAEWQQAAKRWRDVYNRRVAFESEVAS